MTVRFRLLFAVVLAVAVAAFLGSVSPVSAGEPQTITVDGVNDFLPSNLLDLDGGDTEFAPIDLDTIFITNDANKLYVGFYYDKDSWTNNQLGIMFAVGGPSGGTTDAWGHAIAWNTAPYKPDYQAYCNMDNSWQELRKWNPAGSSWDIIYQGSSSLGWVNNTGFEEVGFNLNDLGVTAGDTVYIEIISSQDGSTKGPLDCMANDDKQVSTPSGTTWDLSTPAELDSMYMYIVQSAGDTIPPTVEYAKGAEVPDLVSINEINLYFSEAVDEMTAEDPSNYTLTGTTATIDSVVKDDAFPYLVHIYLDSVIGPQPDFYRVMVTNVKDIAGNVIDDDGTTNVGCFFLKGVLFRGLMGLYLINHSTPPDTFTIEGDLLPLTFTYACDNAFMTDMGDSTYDLDVVFSLVADDCTPGSELADTTLEWKFMHQCNEYEPLPSNRITHFTNLDGPYDTLEFWWNDEDQNDYTSHDMDVLFTVDMNRFSPGVDSVVAINGSVLPLTFDVPSLSQMYDDGTHSDEMANDGIYSLLVRFPALSYKNVEYKFLYNDRYECQGQGNRSLWLNDAAYDTLGGPIGPLEMPLAYFDRCGVIGRDVEVIFTVDAHAVMNPGAPDTIYINGTPNNKEPHVISWDIPSINPMRDDGVYPDTLAGDRLFTRSIIFPDSSDKYVEYKYLFNESYECTTQTNRYFYIDDRYDAAGNPQRLDLDYFNDCATGIEDFTPNASLVKLYQNFPNPFNPVTTISFYMPKAGHAVLRVYNINGELVRTLLDDNAPKGQVYVTWDGTDNRGSKVGSGVYFYQLKVGNAKESKKMILLK
ncbi:hypothetical protein DRQ05_00885 [bacterium]|nr:MAG: hypothetical protein DRQ05_00885 [bacterium]